MSSKKDDGFGLFEDIVNVVGVGILTIVTNIKIFIAFF